MEIGKRAFEVLQKISFERLGGTKEELDSLHIIQEEVNKLGVENVIEVFYYCTLVYYSFNIC